MRIIHSLKLPEVKLAPEGGEVASGDTQWRVVIRVVNMH